MADGRGSYTERTEIALSANVKDYVTGIKDKQAAFVAIRDQYSRAIVMENNGLTKLTGIDRLTWFIYWERAAQVAMKWYIMPEIPLGYAYRLKLLGFTADSYAMDDIVRASGGLYKAEMIA